jgi:hypothetical protein
MSCTKYFTSAHQDATASPGDDAIEQFRAALDIWKDADPEYIPPQEARARLMELEAIL